MKAYGTPNLTAPSFAQCRGPRSVGFELTFGDAVGSPEQTDIENSKCIVLIGSHIGENMHNTQVQEFSKAVKNKASIIVVDPRFSIAAGKAKHYLPIKPGTDTALLLAWMNVIVNEGLYDKEYIKAFGYGFEQFKVLIQENTPEWAYPITGIDPDIIRTTAREMAKNSPATLIHPGRHSTWYGNDTQRCRAVALLNALLGSWGRKGGLTAQYNMEIPPYKYPEYKKSKKGKVDNPGNKYPFASDTISTGIRKAAITGKPYPIKGWFVYATNLMQCLPNREETIKAIKNLDLLVVTEVVPSEIAGWADVVLPETVYLERYDELKAPLYKQPFVSLRQPVVDPPDNQKPNWWIAKKLAEKLGVGEYFPWKNVEEYLDTRLKGAGLSLQRLKKEGVVLDKKMPIYFEDGAEVAFYTPSGKIEFYSTQLAEKGFDPVPKYEAPEEVPPGYFRLLYGRAPVHTFAKTQSNYLLADMMDENELWVNHDIAKKLELKSGEYVKLKNTEGVVSNKVKLKVTERIRKDCVYMVHGFGQTAKNLKSTYLKGASDTMLQTKYNTDPLAGGTGVHNNFVTFEWEV
jgi:thiosulfate reductase/polysulfide reductase chain A